MKVWFSFDKKQNIVGVWWKDRNGIKYVQWRKACKSLGAVKYNSYIIKSYM